MPAEKKLLVISLGTTPDVFRTTVKSFERDLPDVKFEKFVIVCNTILKKKDRKAELAKAIQESGVEPASVEKIFSNSDDLMTTAENLEFFQIVSRLMEKKKRQGYKIYVNIAGGRKQMSALMLAAAYLSGAEKVFHTPHLRGTETAPEEFNLIEIPYLHLDKLLQSVVGEFDIENRFGGSVARLTEQLETDEAFKLLNKYLDEQSRYKTLKEQFAIKRPLYEAMLQATETIIRNILKGRLMFTPEFQKRVKDFESFYKKILKKEEKEGTIADPFARFCDIAGLRAIFYNSEDWKKAVELVEQSGDFVSFGDGGKLKGDDKSQTSGYRAVHLDLRLNPKKRGRLSEYSDLSKTPCEVQFTTIFAHAWSKTHHALSYKDSREAALPAEKQNELDAAFVAAADNLTGIEEDITTLMKNFYPKKSKKSKNRK